MKKSDLDNVVEKSLRGANLWEEVKDRLRQARRRPVRRPAAAAVHRPRDRRRAAGAADGRAVLGARPDLDAGDRGPHPDAQGEVHDRDRHPQHAAGGAGVASAPRSSTSPAVGKPGQLVEMDDTEKIFSNPTDQRTEDYISGRFG